MKLRWRIPYHLLKPLVLILFHLKVDGAENLPREGGCIIACNHISYLDPPLLGFAAGRELYYLAKEGLFDEVNKFFTWLIVAYNAIPLRRDGVDISVIKHVFQLLRRGEVLVLFPEGTRSTSGELLAPKPGLGFIAWRANVPVIPAYIKGANARIGEILLGRQKIMITFGEAYLPPRSDRNYEAVSGEIMRRIEELSHGDNPR
jgi:1-acyl-sn-glycerol-3-phosphate acyltransferase